MLQESLNSSVLMTIKNNLLGGLYFKTLINDLALGNIRKVPLISGKFLLSTCKNYVGFSSITTLNTNTR